MKNAMKQLAILNATTEEADRIIKAIKTHGAKSVYDAAHAAYNGNSKTIKEMIGDYKTLGIVHKADTAAFAELSAAEKAADYRQAKMELSALSAAVMGSAKSEAKAASSRANGAKGGRPKKSKKQEAL